MTMQFEKRDKTPLKNDRFTTFLLADMKRVKPASINAFRSNGKTRSENAFFSTKFTPWGVSVSASCS